MRTIIAGSRDFPAKKEVKPGVFIDDPEDLIFAHKWLYGINLVRPITAVICGMAQGADMMGYKWAKEKGIEIAEFPADWNGLGKSAGYARNEQMAQNAEALVAFWDGKSKGTKHMIDLAYSYGLEVTVIGV